MIVTIEVNGREKGRLDVYPEAVVKIDGVPVSVPEPKTAGPETYTWGEIAERPGVYRHASPLYSSSRFVVNGNGLQIHVGFDDGSWDLVDDDWKMPRDRYIEADEKLSDLRITFADHRELLSLALEALELCTGSCGHHDTGKAHRVVAKLKLAIGTE